MHELPVLVLAYNRPLLLEGLLLRLGGLNSPIRAYVALDGPRLAASDRELVAATIAVAREFTPEDRVLARPENLGLARAVPDALDWFFAREPAGVVLEDDCWPSPDFFVFAQTLLERGPSSRLGSVCGSNFASRKSDGEGVFLNEPHVWGWGTWASVWQEYSESVERSAIMAGDQTARLVYGPTWWYRRRLLHRWITGSVESWAIPFLHFLARTGRYAALPDVNLVSNVGTGPAATHTRGRSAFAHRPVGSWKPSSPDLELDVNRLYSYRVAAMLAAEVGEHSMKRLVRRGLMVNRRGH